MKQILLILAFFFFTLASHAQVRRLQVSVYFDSDKAVLRKDALQTLNALVDSLENFEVKSIQVMGNTDNEGDSLYNIKLSDKRTGAVSGYLKKRGFHDTLFKPRHFGENKPMAPNETPAGMQKNRRVDITVYYVPASASSRPVPVPELEVKKDTLVTKVKDTCSGDTVIHFPDGTQVVFNRCDYLDWKNCLEMIEVKTPEAAMENELNTMTVDGDPLVSCGMFGMSMSMKPGCKRKDCFDHPVKVRFPIPQASNCVLCGPRAGLYNQGANGGWERDPRRLEKVVVDGKEYYEYSITCPGGGFKNCDCGVNAKKVKLKTPRRYEIVSVTYSTVCPFSVVTYSPGRWRKNIVKKPIPCFMGAGNVNAVVRDKKTGDTLLLTLRPLIDLEEKIGLAACRNPDPLIVERNILGRFPYKRRELYRKYVVKEEELTPKEKN